MTIWNRARKPQCQEIVNAYIQVCNNTCMPCLSSTSLIQHGGLDNHFSDEGLFQLHYNPSIPPPQQPELELHLRCKWEWFNTSIVFIIIISFVYCPFLPIGVGHAMSLCHFISSCTASLLMLSSFKSSGLFGPSNWFSSIDLQIHSSSQCGILFSLFHVSKPSKSLFSQHRWDLF